MPAPSLYEWIVMAAGAALILSLGISENWIAAIARARRAWSDSNGPLREKVQDYKNQFGALMNTHLPKNIPDTEYAVYKATVDALLNEAANWIGEHIGQVARDQLLDRSNKPAVYFTNAAHDRHNNLLLDIAAIRRNLDAIKGDLR